LHKSTTSDSAAPVFEYSEAAPEASDKQAWAGTLEPRKFPDEPDYILRAWAAVLIVASIDWLWAEHVGFSFSGYLPVGSAVAVLAAIGCFYQFTRRDRKLADLGHYCALWIAFPVMVNMYSYVIATLRLPLQDAQFSQMDGALGFHWLVWLGRIEPHHLIWLALVCAYNSIFVQVFVSVVFFSFAGRSDRNRELLWTSMLAALITVSISGLLPAYGPYTDGKMPEWSAVLQTIREGHATNFRIADMKGIVAFPSFHTVLGLLLVYAHRPPARTFVPVVILNAVMLLAIPFAGHHYLVDMIAGAVVVTVSIAIVQAAMRTQGVLRDAHPVPHPA
jgi:hypothetical protein